MLFFEKLLLKLVPLLYVGTGKTIKKETKWRYSG